MQSGHERRGRVYRVCGYPTNMFAVQLHPSKRKKKKNIDTQEPCKSDISNLGCGAKCAFNLVPWDVIRQVSLPSPAIPGLPSLLSENAPKKAPQDLLSIFGQDEEEEEEEEEEAKKGGPSMKACYLLDVHNDILDTGIPYTRYEYSGGIMADVVCTVARCLVDDQARTLTLFPRRGGYRAVGSQPRQSVVKLSLVRVCSSWRPLRLDPGGGRLAGGSRQAEDDRDLQAEFHFPGTGSRSRQTPTDYDGDAQAAKECKASLGRIAMCGGLPGHSITAAEH
ncbi:hypothetical protein BDP55DRAFT_717918 [Colletotrichum godetiae]|uniref:Uncharacterized protein n=1 Tax=Colletotrichum godetiae TaxID=1209918 RepID=A0AAJ0AF35_9PEZI|nr:uncharacterized protein BDP55DRAFT_717918 [Colletotrichum godetiae]KAK1672731.1 hypothetical protein BDP55DRAFT_717918 [Colletotrichum godetiae]